MMLTVVTTMKMWSSQWLPCLLLVSSLSESYTDSRRGFNYEIPNYKQFDRIITSYMNENRIPGASIAISRDGEDVLRKGYGQAGLRRIVTPWSLFRIGSISKTVTATGILRLYEDNKLKLQAKVFGSEGILGHYDLPLAADPRLLNISVENLLQHCGGWDQRLIHDPMMQRSIGEYMGEKDPPSLHTIVRYMLKQPLQHSPGTVYAYSNFGYVLLGLIIEKVSGLKYDHFIKTNLRRVGVYRMKLGATRKEDADLTEVQYYSKYPNDRVVSVFDPGKLVSPPYGGFNLEHMAASSGWLASASELVKLYDSISGQGRWKLLEPATFDMMLQAPNYTRGSVWYGLGLVVQYEGESWWHSGTLEGSTSMVAHDRNGYTWAALLNYKLDNNDLADVVRYAIRKSIQTDVTSEDDVIPRALRKVVDSISADGENVVKVMIPDYRFQETYKSLANKGYTMTWIDAYNEYGYIYFNTIWKRNDPGNKWKVYINLSASRYRRRYKAKVAQGYRLLFIETYVSRRRLRYAAIFVRDIWPKWVTYEGYSVKRHKVQFYRYLKEGYRLVVQSVTEYRGKLYIAAIYDRINLGEFRVRMGLTLAEYTSELEKQLKSGRILSYVQSYEHRGVIRFSAIWMARTTKAWAVSHGMTKYTLLNKLQEYADANVPLACVTAYNDGDYPSFAALWR